MIEVLQPGLVTTVQDQGRFGFEAYGVPKSGTFDPFLAEVANRLVGNPAGTPLLEFALIGPNVRFHTASRIAVCGFGVRYVAERSAPIVPFRSTEISEGTELRFAGMGGWFGYISFAGGIQAPQVLGSASAYVAGMIGKKISKDDFLSIGKPSGSGYVLRKDDWNLTNEPVLRIVPAQHTVLFQDQERQKLCKDPYRISAQSNRMGIRLEGASLDGPVLRRSVPALPGALQVPRSGLPLVLGPEGPTTGGYAQLGMIARVSWTSLAAAPPGASVQFEWTNAERARTMWAERQKLFTMKEAWERV